MFIKVVKQSTSDVTAINVSEIASVGEQSGDCVIVHTKAGGRHYVKGSYDEVLLLARGFIKLPCLSPCMGEVVLRVADINWVRPPINPKLSTAEFCDVVVSQSSYLTVGMPMNKLLELL